MELELIKQNIHMNRWKNQVSSQITLDDDFIVPDTLDDIAQVILSSGEILLEPAKVQSERVVLRGKLDFRILYRREAGGLQALGGNIPFEETVNVPELEEQDSVNVSWQLEDLHAEMINSRKLSIKALVILEIKSETIFHTEAALDAAVDTEHSDAQIETRHSRMEVAAIALHRKDTHRIREEITLSGSKPGISRILWTEMRLAGVNVRPLDGRVQVDGTLVVFVIYEGEGDQPMTQWVEESLPFSGEVEVPAAVPEMIPAVFVRLIHKALEEKPDYDGEMRQIDVDAVAELDIRLYQEQPIELLTDLYATNREITAVEGEAVFDRILTHNTGKCRLAEKVPMDADARILQICHSSGTVKIDAVEVLADQGTLSIDGVLEVQMLYLTDEDLRPMQSVSRLLPFHYEAETPGITKESIWYLEPGLEQLTAALTGGGQAEVKAMITLELLVLQPVKQRIIRQAQAEPLDLKKLQQMPGIAGYLVQPGDELWDIAKRFHTTMETVMTMNHLNGETIHPGDCLILVKEVTGSL